MPELKKKQLRQQIRAALGAMTEAQRREKSARIMARALATPEYQAARTAMAFDSFGTEVRTEQFLIECLHSGKALCLPRAIESDYSISIHRVADLGADLEICQLGFREPKPTLPCVPREQIDFILLPGLGYDLSGNRLGRGKGYYDRFLSSPDLRGIFCAVTFECQIVAAVPTLAHDRRVQLIVTEERVIRPGQ